MSGKKDEPKEKSNDFGKRERERDNVKCPPHVPVWDDRHKITYCAVCGKRL